MLRNDTVISMSFVNIIYIIRRYVGWLDRGEYPPLLGLSYGFQGVWALGRLLRVLPFLGARLVPKVVLRVVDLMERRWGLVSG